MCCSDRCSCSPTPGSAGPARRGSAGSRVSLFIAPPSLRGPWALTACHSMPAAARVDVLLKRAPMGAHCRRAQLRGAACWQRTGHEAANGCSRGGWRRGPKEGPASDPPADESSPVRAQGGSAAAEPASSAAAAPLEVSGRRGRRTRPRVDFSCWAGKVASCAASQAGGVGLLEGARLRWLQPTAFRGSCEHPTTRGPAPCGGPAGRRRVHGYGVSRHF